MEGDSMFRNKNKTVFIILLLLILVITVTACDNNDNKQKPQDKSDIPEEKRSSFLMDTIVDIKVYGEKAEEIVEKSFARMREIEDEMSRSKESSYISKINKNAGKKAVKVDEDTFRVIEKALKYAELTNGKFDPTIGPVVSLWGIGTKDARVPSDQEINDTKNLVNYKLVEGKKD